MDSATTDNIVKIYANSKSVMIVIIVAANRVKMKILRFFFYDFTILCQTTSTALH